LCLGRGLVGEFLFFFRVTGFFSLIVTMTVQAPGIAFHHPTPKGPNPDTLLPTK